VPLLILKGSFKKTDLLLGLVSGHRPEGLLALSLQLLHAETDS